MAFFEIPEEEYEKLIKLIDQDYMDSKDEDKNSDENVAEVRVNIYHFRQVWNLSEQKR
ncbi:MAG: hypothetical protein ACRCUS_05315 [Anaerovoracaceae bacterium]